jgi:hypothetical protein
MKLKFPSGQLAVVSGEEVKILVFPSLTVTCCHLSAFLYWIEVYSTDIASPMGKFPKVLNFTVDWLTECWPYEPGWSP